MSEIIEGFTPTLTFEEFPFKADEIDELNIVFMQECDDILTKFKEDCTIVEDKKVMYLTLTAEDTELFKHCFNDIVFIFVKVKLTDGTIVPFTRVKTRLRQIIADEAYAIKMANVVIVDKIEEELERRLQALDLKIVAESEIRERVDTILQGSIDNIDQTLEVLEAQDVALASEIADETVARSNADEVLSNEIASEVASRQTADTQLGLRIDSTNTALQTETSARQSADNVLAGSIVAETEARKNDVTALDGKIDGEITARTNADSTLDTKIDNAVSELSTTISNEVTVRENADTQLDTKIDNVVDELETKIEKSVFAPPVKIADRLYKMNYDTYDYAKGVEYMEQYKYTPACSAVRKGNIVGRNYDWYYGEEPSFIVETKASNSRFATIGIAHGFGELTNSLVDMGTVSEHYKILPFMMADVINEHGVYVNINVVHAGDKGYTTGTNPAKEDLCQLMIPRFIGDYASSAREAVQLLNGRNVYAPLNQIGIEAHFLICDKTDTYIVEFVDNEMVVFSSTDDDYSPIPNDRDIMVNFYVDGWNGDIKAVYSGDSEADVIATGMNLHAMGLERYNILADRYSDIEDRQDMLDAMMAVKYTKSYESSTAPYWYSEFTQEDGENRFGELTILNTAEDFRPIVEYIQNEYQHRQRDKKTWYTAHTSIYDLETKSLMVCVEELYDKSYKDKLISALNTNNNVQISVSGSTLIITIED